METYNKPWNPWVKSQSIQYEEQNGEIKNQKIKLDVIDGSKQAPYCSLVNAFIAWIAWKAKSKMRKWPTMNKPCRSRTGGPRSPRFPRRREEEEETRWRPNKKPSFVWVWEQQNKQRSWSFNFQIKWIEKTNTLSRLKGPNKFIQKRKIVGTVYSEQG